MSRDTSPGAGDDRRLLPAALGIGGILVLLYAVMIAQQLLLGFVVVALLFGLYLGYRFLLAVERLAEGVHRIGRALEDGAR